MRNRVLKTWLYYYINQLCTQSLVSLPFPQTTPNPGTYLELEVDFYILTSLWFSYRPYKTYMPQSKIHYRTLENIRIGQILLVANCWIRNKNNRISWRMIERVIEQLYVCCNNGALWLVVHVSDWTTWRGLTLPTTVQSV